MSGDTDRNRRPVVLGDDDKVDPLASYQSVRVTSRQLRDGMLIVDDLGCPVYVLDHRIGPVPGGVVEWLAEDVERGGWQRVPFNTTKVPTIPVAAS